MTIDTGTGEAGATDTGAANVDASESEARSRSYATILKSTALMGGSSVINTLLSAVRAKASALILGAEGVGLMGLFLAVLDLAQALTGLGLQNAAVRQIASETDADGQHRRATIIWILRTASIVLGFLGAALLAIFATPIARLSFGSESFASAVALVGLALIFRIVGAGQMALLQGIRQIGNLARVSVYSALLGTIVSIPILYLLGHDGIVPAIVAISAVSILPSWYYARRTVVRRQDINLNLAGRDAVALLRLGLVFLASGLLTFGAAYLVRTIVLHAEGPRGVGFFQAAWTIGGLYAGFILQAMGTDFYPRLTAVANDKAECNRLVNEQAQIGILLAGPGLLATLTLAPLAIHILYSAEFIAGADLLRWICLGMMLRIVSWPMGYIIIARNAQFFFFWTEVAAAIVQVGLAWLLVDCIGLAGAGMAFFGLYVWHSLLVYVIVRRMTGFAWSRENLRLMSFVLGMTAITFIACLALPTWQATVIGGLATTAASYLSLRSLRQFAPIRRLLPTKWR